jgi:hypothetical protein
MSCSIYAYACSENTSDLFKKHLNALRFCIDNNLSLPIETK